MSNQITERQIPATSPARLRELAEAITSGRATFMWPFFRIREGHAHVWEQTGPATLTCRGCSEVYVRDDDATADERSYQ